MKEGKRVRFFPCDFLQNGTKTKESLTFFFFFLLNLSIPYSLYMLSDYLRFVEILK